MKMVAALLAGLLFGLGLTLSGMTNPSKVLGFLDLAGDWDPSLAFVMGGALLVGALVFPFAARLPKSILGDAMRVPTATQIDRRLVWGSLTFGVGWGLAGYCPGPALASLAQGGIEPLLFSMALLAGMALFELLEGVKNSSDNKGS
jgi:uncharacterized protein